MTRRSNTEYVIDLVSSCRKSAKEVISDYEDQSRENLFQLKSSLTRDLREISGNDTDVEIIKGAISVYPSTSDVRTIVDTYVRVYPEVTFLFRTE